MPQTVPLTSDQAQLLSQLFHDLAAAIEDFRGQQATVLSDQQQLQLESFQNRCLQFSNRFAAMSLFAQEQDLDATLQQIADSTKQACDAIRTIGIVDKVLEIATAAAVLGESIVTLNPDSIGSGIKGLFSAITGENE